MPVVNALEFLAACLTAGLGLFLTSEALIRLRPHLAGRAVSHALAVAGGIVATLSGGLWATSIARW